MQIGTQFHFPEGLSGFSKGVDYILAHQDRAGDRVAIVAFPDEKHPIVVMLDRATFEQALDEGKVAEKESQSTLPSWLVKLEGKNIELIDERRRTAKVSLSEYVAHRLAKIDGMIASVDTIFAQKNPIREINRLTRKIRPSQNEARIRLWLLLYLAYGRNKWALLPSFTKCGGWWKDIDPEQDSTPTKKRGCPSKLHGKNHGFNVDEAMLEKIIDGYAKYSGLRIALKRVYFSIIAHVFGCRVTHADGSEPIIFHPENAPYPSLGAFRYHINKHIGRNAVRETIYGPQRFRHEEATSKGHYSQELAFLGERLEIDAYVIEDRPAAFIPNEFLEAMHATTGRDVLSGAVLGIGFGLGGECSTTYRNLAFSMAVDKVFYCKLFGVDIKKEQWPCIGLPPNLLTDRGPGMSADFMGSTEDETHILQFARSFEPRDKASIETSNPKKYRVDGKPLGKHVLLNPVELAKGEINRVLAANRKADMSLHVTPEMIALGIGRTPLALWNFFTERGRSQLIQVSFENAVRKFLTRVEVSVKEDGVYMNGQRYFSYDLDHSGYLEHAKRHGEFKSRAFILDMCVRTIWVDHRDGLIETAAVLNIRDDDSQLYLCLAEQNLLGKMNHLAILRHQEISNAANLAYELENSELSAAARQQGRKEFSAGSHTPPSRQATKEAKSVVSSRHRGPA